VRGFGSAITFALALASERWIERPFRRPRSAQAPMRAPEPASILVKA
jgi:peptidoglycan/LPS O-acetylase OafA/YrhL